MKKLIRFVALPLLLLAGGVGGAYYMGLLDSLLGPPGSEQFAAQHRPEAIIKIEDMLANLISKGRKPTFVKLGLSLEMHNPIDVVWVGALLPRIVDSYQVYLHNLRLEDLEGAAGINRMTDELIKRTNAITEPIRVKAILFREMIIQHR